MDLKNLTWIEIIYWASTIIGGILFLLRAALFFIAGAVDGDMVGDHGDIDVHQGDVDVHHGDVDAHHGDSDVSFKFLSLQSMTAFFMMFGLSGLALVSSGIPTTFTILGGVVIGFFTVWVISLVFATMGRLQSEGTIRIKNAIGKSGSVYLTIPKNGTGQVRVSVQGSLKVFDAVSADKRKIQSGESIKVVDVMSDRVLVVEIINHQN
jgi:membrane protein implicated in regulation of membrane protease activity